ncbi:hypothetical protein HSX37_16785|uniref:Uncharacterized protein n=1 Tax=Dendrosporobacter quercicolus TaxID=146817 RepID=A0A1G9XFV1_9FIRM|nr:hypothetical protein [Dendrosporobacter quercicolus]NSL49689.1 hypothetical protein [Dendrosporobacter quercicolus DSM 1736]SDM95145.1 hypothetical protein SAMN04488502_10975 [Dendrosporobacter quercicolus]
MVMKKLIFSFVETIKQKQLIMVTFQMKANNQIVQRKCAPLDLAPSKRTKSIRFKFHLWDMTNSHVLSLEPNQIMEFEVSGETFEPESIINWNTSVTSWCVQRDWGKLS